MTATTPPADFHEDFSVIVPIMVICLLLGVPPEDRERFRRWTQMATQLWDVEAVMSGHQQLRTYMNGLIERKREAPAEDVISDLIAAQPEEAWLTEEFMLDLCVGLLIAGHETTVGRIDLGTLLLLAHPDQRDALRRDPGLATGAVEEILRVAAPSIGVLMHYAAEDIEIADVTIRAGDLVLIGSDAANRDPSAFPEPDRFDITRDQNQHVAFAHGHLFCLGAGLARAELQTVFATLFQRVPNLRLAVPLDGLRIREDTPLGGLVAMPVAW
jgi:pentalenolactone synthase